MAVDKYGNILPKGIFYKDGIYLGRFQYKKEKYSVRHKDLNTAIEMLEDKKYEVRHGMCAKPNKLTFAEWFSKWIEEHRVMGVTKIRKSTYNQYKSHYKCYISDGFKRKRITDISNKDVIKLFDIMVEKDYSYNTIKSFRNMLSGVFSDAVTEGLLVDNPVANAKIPKKDLKEEQRVLTVEEAVKFLEYAKFNELYYFFVTALESGLRCGELCALQWNCIDFKNRRIKVKHTLQYNDGEYNLGEPKTQTSLRNVLMTDKAYTMLLEWKELQQSLKEAMGKKWVPLSDIDNLVFTLSTGKPLSKAKIRDEINRIVDTINADGFEMEHITSHTFRHSFATRCLENGVSLKVLQQLLGHAKLETTVNTYVHVLRGLEHREIYKLNGWENN